jgi:myo-inositol-1(or 4)-monophosphatase
MKSQYQIIIDFILNSGKRLYAQSKLVSDSERMSFFKMADIEIERGLKDIIRELGDEYTFFSEEENHLFQDSKNLWVADPISGTQSFLNGLPHYCLVVSHLVNSETRFACIYDPSVDELFTAYKNEGAFLNKERIYVNNETKTVTIRGVAHFQDQKLVQRLLSEVPKLFKEEKSFYSYSYNYCSVAVGRLGGLISLTKDSFPEYAGSLLIREAGGFFTNDRGETNFSNKDRIFISGNKMTYEKLFSLSNSDL